MVQESRSTVEAQPAYVLHRSPFKENSYLLDVFTRDYGYVRLVARGAGRKKSSGAAQLQVFQPLLLSWAGRSELKTLTAYESPSLPISLFGKRLYCAYYLNELLLYLAPPWVALGDIFVFYSHALSELSQSSLLEIPLRRFELRLLGDLGLKPDFQGCGGGALIEPEQDYYLTEDGVFELCQNPLEHNSSVYRGDTLLWLSRDCPDGEAGATTGDASLMPSAATEDKEVPVETQSRRSRQAKRMMRYLIDQALNGRSLKSREMLKQMTEVRT